MSLVLLAVLGCQATWIVDANNAPGTHFTDLPTAVAAAAHGDTLLVRKGNYLPFQVSGKALTIRGAGAAGAAVTRVFLPAGPMLTWYSVVDAVPAGSVFCIDGIAFGGNGNPFTGIEARGSTTVLTLADCSSTGGLFFAPTSGMAISGATVLAVRCDFTGGSVNAVLGFTGGAGLELSGGTLVAADCRFFGGSSQASRDFETPWGGAGLRIVHGSAVLHDCQLYGGNARSTAFFGPARGGWGIESIVNASTVRLSGTRSAIVKSGLPMSWSIGASNAATIAVHDGVTLTGTPVVPPNVTLGLPALPRLTIGGTTTPAGEIVIGHPIAVSVTGGLPGAPFVLGYAAVPAVATAFAPWTLGAVLLPPAVFVGLASLDAQGRFQHVYPGTTLPALVGVPVFGQVGMLDAAAGVMRMSSLELRLFR